MSASDADQLWSTTNGAGLSLHRIRIGPDQTTSKTNIAKLAIARGATVWATSWTPPSVDKTGEKKATVGGTLSNPTSYATSELDHPAHQPTVSASLPIPVTRMPRW